MPRVDTFTVNAFTRDSLGGNPAGVVLDANGLSEGQMAAIAAELGMSETAFVMASQSCDLRVRFFTPSSEVQLCGHATIAAWHLLLERGAVPAGEYTMETLAGPQSISCRQDGLVTMSQNLPQFGAILAPGPVAAVLGLEGADLLPSEQMPVQIASTGLHKIFAPIGSLSAIRRITPDLAAIEALSREHGAIGIYCFTLETLHGASAHCRNFAPVVGIKEDSATGTSAAATACLLVHHGLVATESRTELSFEQGDAIDQPSEILVSLQLDGPDFRGVFVSGRARTESMSALELDGLELL